MARCLTLLITSCPTLLSRCCQMSANIILMMNKKESSSEVRKSIQIERPRTGPVKVVDLIKSCSGLRRHILSWVITTLVRPESGNEARHDFPPYFRSDQLTLHTPERETAEVYGLWGTLTSLVSPLHFLLPNDIDLVTILTSIYLLSERVDHFRMCWERLNSRKENKCFWIQ